MNIAVCGLGYVGSVTAVCMARAGHNVIGVDVNEEKARMMREGVPPVIEEGLAPLLQEMVLEGRLAATTDLKLALQQADVTLVCVGTPSRTNGSLDTAALERVCEDLGRALRHSPKPHTIIMRSTVLPGTCRNLLIPIIEETAGKACDDSLGVVYNPEFMREGTSVKDFYTPPFTIIGRDSEHHGSVAAALYASIEAPLERTSIEASEMLKYACNAFHAMKISFANEIGVFASEHGIDGREVMRMLCLDKKLNISPSYLKPGFAFGGSCLPKDLRALLYRAKQADLRLPVLDAILQSNTQHLRRGIELIKQTGKTKIGMLGLTFKSGTDDLRESPYVDLAETLLGKGYKLRIHDDNVETARLVGANAAYINNHLPHLTSLLGSIEDVMNHAEVIVVCNGDPQYATAIRHRRSGQQVIDLIGVPQVDNTRSRRVVGIAW
ncbi:MAG TPA: UDP-glucose/GDP-mannose dehydrogenase family protein [Planctomycetota bacterium]|nr:UDP-glucose/GDP-mannose dehydrogenase family protein [Planctomycetota bacterium]